MLFILAVEPDPAQVPHIESMTQKPGTQVAIAASSRAALCAMVERLPDMLLVSRALPLADQKHLKAFIQGLGPAASHVRVLPTPRPVSQIAPGPRAVPPAPTIVPKGDRPRNPLSTISSTKQERGPVRVIPYEQTA